MCVFLFIYIHVSVIYVYLYFCLYIHSIQDNLYGFNARAFDRFEEKQNQRLLGFAFKEGLLRWAQKNSFK